LWCNFDVGVGSCIRGVGSLDYNVSECEKDYEDDDFSEDDEDYII
jgi:hypothetical protein